MGARTYCVAISGASGSGKSTLSDLLASILRAGGIDVAVIHHRWATEADIHGVPDDTRLSVAVATDARSWLRGVLHRCHTPWIRI